MRQQMLQYENFEQVGKNNRGRECEEEEERAARCSERPEGSKTQPLLVLSGSHPLQLASEQKKM